VFVDFACGYVQLDVGEVSCFFELTDLHLDEKLNSFVFVFKFYAAN
jgi:hypothetical protein